MSFIIYSIYFRGSHGSCRIYQTLFEQMEKYVCIRTAINKCNSPGQ